MPTNTAVKNLVVDLELNRETKNTVRYDIADDVDFPDLTSVYIQKAALRGFHDVHGRFPESVTVEVTLN